MFQAMVALVAVGNECETFQEAFKHFFEGVNNLVAGGTSRQVLETTCFIRYVFTVESQVLNTQMDFYDCCYLAHEIGLLNNAGDLQERAAREISIEDIQSRFLQSTVMEIYGVLDMVDKTREGAAAG